MAVSERWIKLRLHPEHRKVFELAEALQCSREQAFCCAVRWLWAIDRDPKLAQISMTAEAASQLAGGCSNFAEAAARCGWLRIVKGKKFRVVDFDKWFGSDSYGRRRARTKRAAEQKAEEAETESRNLPAGKGVAMASPNSAVSPAERKAAMEAWKFCIEQCPIGKNNERALYNYLTNVPDPVRFAARIVRQATKQRLDPPRMAAYVFGCVKSEAGKGKL